MKKNIIIIVLLLLANVILLSSCNTDTTRNTAKDPEGIHTVRYKVRDVVNNEYHIVTSQEPVKHNWVFTIGDTVLINKTSLFIVNRGKTIRCVITEYL